MKRKERNKFESLLQSSWDDDRYQKQGTSSLVEIDDDQGNRLLLMKNRGFKDHDKLYILLYIK